MVRVTKFLLANFFIIVLILISLGFVYAGLSDIIGSFFKTAEAGGGGGVDCGRLVGNYSACISLNSSCMWMNNNGSFSDPYCPVNSTNYNSISIVPSWMQTMFGNSSVRFIDLTGGSLVNAGCCGMKAMSGGGGGGGGMSCNSFDGNYSGCSNSSMYGVNGCSWKPNDMNENPQCYVKKVGDWAMGKQITSTINVGCCMKPGCGDYAGVQTASNNCSAALGGVCVFASTCQNPAGCCFPKSCEQVSTIEQCNRLMDIGTACVWSGSACSSGGYSQYNGTSSCMSAGGWINATGGCQMPSSSGGGGFMYAQEARCWFADNRPNVCNNVSGCVYCSDATAQLNNASSACYNVPSGSCKGHEPRFTNWNGTNSINITDINISSMTCGDLRLNMPCNCGPLPGCKWKGGALATGNNCSADQKSNDDMLGCQPPNGVTYCEHPSAKNNQTLCNLLASNYMMPCKFDSVNNCTFNSNAAFGGGGGSSGSGGMDFNVISNQVSCVAASGTWKTSYYEDAGSFKSDSWCEKAAMFSFSSGQSYSNTGSCDSDCWACNFNSTGGAWSNNVTLAQQACQNSKKGVCIFNVDANAPNRLGRCEYPKEMSFGGSTKDCNTDCKSCELMGGSEANSSIAYAACINSPAGCKWSSDTTAMNGKGGYCISSSKTICSGDCFSCYDQSSCSNSSYHTAMNCSWDSISKFCKPQGCISEICFNGVDDDNNGKIDCADSACAFDQFCGGASMGSSNISADCKRKIDQTSCSLTRTPSGVNCTWKSSACGTGCDYPGSDCMMYDNNISACRKDIRGCIYRNATAGYPLGSGGPAVTVKSFSGFCDINKTKSDICYNVSNRINLTSCNANNECIWIVDSYMTGSGGRCEFKPFAICGNRTQQTCSTGGFCSWKNDSYSPSGGFCEPGCSMRNQTSCVGFCAYKSSICEPEIFSNGEGMCHINDGNQTGCISMNSTCTWKTFSQNSSVGICQPNGEQQMMGGMDMGSSPKVIGMDINDTDIKEIDIREFGIKDSPSSLGFGIVVTNITNAAVCKGYYIGGMGGGMGMPILGNGTTTTKYYWYLDTNKNSVGGCNASNELGVNLTGFEFLIKYIVSLSNQTVVEQKSLMRCSGGDWIMTNVPLTSNRQMCGVSAPAFGNQPAKLGNVMILVDKEQLKSFAEYNQTAPMRIFVTSANASTSEFNPLDSAAPGYYTPGSVDFNFVDCSNPSTKDPKCKNFQQYGFNIFEDCKNTNSSGAPLDDDGDGLANCDDPKCKFTPVCSGGRAFNFSADSNDNQAPTITFSQVDVLRDSAFVKFDTDEPANGTVDFYYNDSTCNSLNISKSDLGDPVITFDDYKPFHMVNLDLNNLGYSLDNGTVYYYKTSVCDPSSNCATSACLNFTTSSEAYKNFIFRMSLPVGYNVTIPQLNYSGNFTKAIGGVIYDVGIKTNASVSRNINITVNCGSQSLTFVGADVLKPKSIDMSGAFICDSNSTSNILGMNSSSKSWNQLIGDIGMGGSSDYIKLSYPITYSADNPIKWCSDDLSNCTTVNDYANCSSGGTGKTDCKIPTSLGFSAYQITSVAVTTPVTSPASSGGSGGGGGAAVKKNVTKNTTNIVTNPYTPSVPGTGKAVAGENPSAQQSSGEQVESGAASGSFAWLLVVISIVIILILLVAGVIYLFKKRRE
jgi:hypothetical protein